MRIVEEKQKDVGIKADDGVHIAVLEYADDAAVLALMLISLVSIL